MTQNVQLAGVMASILGCMAVAGLTLGSRMQQTQEAAPTVEVRPVISEPMKRTERVPTPKIAVRLTYSGVSLNSDENDSAQDTAASQPVEHAASDVECSASAASNAISLNQHCLGLTDEMPENTGLASMALPYFTPVEGKVR